MTNVTILADTLRNFWPLARQARSNDQELIAAIKDTADTFQGLTDRELPARVRDLRTLVEEGTAANAAEVLIPAFGLVFESARRTLGIAFYDVQLLAGLVLSRNAIAQMATGEGKTLVGVLPSFSYALYGRGVHFMTTNAYLAVRDYEIVRPIFAKLGVTIGVLREDDSPVEKRQAYACDITYGPGYEFGFDYLRDQVALLQQPKPQLGQTYRQRRKGNPVNTAKMVQRGHAYAIVDELDSVLIDEATTPLILSGAPASENPHPQIYQVALSTADALTLQEDYVYDPAVHKLRLTKAGLARAYVGLEQIAHLPLRRPWPEYVEQGLHARLRLKRDVDYVVQDEQVKIVDQLTGRIFADRTWRNGLHQLVEAKEGITVSAENEPLAQISRQQYFRLYDGLCGMTGTATGSEREFRHFYDLPVSEVPTRKPNQRRVLPTRFFSSSHSKWDAIAHEVERLARTGQPILVGTRTIESSQIVAQRLDARNLSYQLLNGKQDEEEATIVACAGKLQAITIATNMAGRGTDIKLGPGVEELGGLHVIVTEAHESQRIDRQLIGRAARQGDPGSCQSFVSAEDQLIELHAPWLAEHLKRKANEQGEVLESLDREIARIQRQVERKNYTKRRRLFAHDTWLEDVLAKLAKSD